MTLLFNKLRLTEITKVPVRYKNGPNHWATLRKKKTAKIKALEHFDDFYTSVYGNTWPDIRAALLNENNKYMAVVNNFSDVERIKKSLELQGAMDIKRIYHTFKTHIDDCRKFKRKSKFFESDGPDIQMESVISNTQLSEVQSVYPADYEQAPQSLRSEETEGIREDDEPVKDKKAIPLKSIEKDLNEYSLATERIVTPFAGSTVLNEYMPATKIKGLEDWVLESDYYKHYTKGSDFMAEIQKEPILSFPEHLNVYTFEEGNDTRFPSPKIGSTGVLDYYLFDGGSVLPVLALDLQAGDAVLDMCAAPGGKALTILQTLMPRLFVANDHMLSRVKRINNVLQQFVASMGQWEGRLFVTEQDARTIEDKDIYNKILVDVPCTTDRHVLHTDENNLFKSTRLKERLRIPELQTAILANALRLVRVGGTVVYSTCTLSPVQNDGVVQMALKTVAEETGNVMIVKDLTDALRPLRSLYKFGNAGLKYGQIVVPTLTSNWGPMYFCKIVRVR